MSERITISQIAIEGFGGLTNLELDLPDAPLVVVAGPNQAGKSTVAEALMWTLAGPRGTAAHAQRFGPPKSKLSASVRGHLGSAAFDLRSTFRILPARAPKVGRFDAELDGRPIDHAQWLAQLGPLATDGIHAVHRIDGVDGHEVERATEVLHLASAGMLGGADPGPAAARLRDASRLLDRSKANGVRSAASLKARRVEAHESLERAATNADDYAAVQQQVEEQRRIQVEAAAASDEAQASLHHVATASSAIGADLEVGRLRQVLDGLPEVPTRWQALLPDVEAIRSDAAFQRDELPALRHHVERAEQLARELSTTPAALAALEIGDDALTEVASIHQAHASNAATLREAIATHERDEAALVDATEDARGVAPFAPGALAAPSADEATSIATAIRRVEDRLATADQRKVRLASASAAVADAQRNLDASTRSWDRFETGSTAERYLRAVPNAAEPPPARWWVVPALAALVVALIGFASAQVLLGVGSLLVAGLCGFIGFAARRPAGAAPVESHRAVTDAALAVVSAGQALQSAQLQQGTIAEEHAAAIEDLTVAHADLRAHLVRSGVPPSTLGPSDHVDLPAIVETWQRLNDARAKLAEVDAAARRAKRSAAEVEAARASLRSSADQLRAQFHAIGMPPPADLAEATAELRALRSAATQARRGAEAEAAIAGHLGRVDAVCGVAAEADLHVVLAEVERLRGVAQQRQQVADDIAAHQRDRAARIGGSAAVERLLASHPDADALASEVRRLGAASTEARSRHEAATTELGRLDQVARELAAQSSVAELSQEVGRLDEEIADLALGALARAIAADLIDEEAARERRERQPELVRRTSEVACRAIPSWTSVRVERTADEDHGVALVVEQHDGVVLAAELLSTGARAVLYLALRAAVADERCGAHGTRLPLVCDDPLVHLDDVVAAEAMAAMADISTSRQVIVFTCHERTVRAARQAGAQAANLGGGVAADG